MTEASHSQISRFHARILPAFVVKRLPKSLKGMTGPITPFEMLCWERGTPLTAIEQSVIREEFLRSTRASFIQYWDLHTGIATPTGASLALLDAEDQKRLKKLGDSLDAPLANLSLREIKAVLHTSLANILTFLSNVESIDWVPPAAWDVPAKPARRETTKPGGKGWASLQVTDELKEKADALQEFANAFGETDLRFADILPNESVYVWLWVNRNAPVSDERLPIVLERLAAYQAMDAAQEAHCILAILAERAFAKNNQSDVVARNLKLVTMRYMSAEGTGSTRNELAQEFGLSGQGVTNVCHKVGFVLDKVPVAAPSLAKLMAALVDVCPGQIASLNENPKIRALLGEGFGIRSALEWARELGTETKVRAAEVTSLGVSSWVLESTTEVPWAQALFDLARRDSAMVGCTNLVRVVGLLAGTQQVALTFAAAMDVLSGDPSIKWLDKDTGWFRYGDTSDCPAATRVRKVLSVADTSIGVDEMASALASDDCWLKRQDITGSVSMPPVHVFRELCHSWAGIKVVQQGRLTAAESLRVSEVLAESEFEAVETIRAKGGVATKFELDEALQEKLSFNTLTTAVLLGRSVVFQRIEQGLYTLRGCRISDDALANARLRLRIRQSQRGVTYTGKLEHNDFLVTVTESSLQREQYAVPARFITPNKKAPFDLVNLEGKVLGKGRINESGALKGVNALFPAAKAGDIYKVRVLGDAKMSVEHILSDDPLVCSA